MPMIWKCGVLGCTYDMHEPPTHSPELHFHELVLRLLQKTESNHKLNLDQTALRLSCISGCSVMLISGLLGGINCDPEKRKGKNKTAVMRKCRTQMVRPKI